MRNRTELLTNTLPSENEDEPSDLDDSEEDWKPSEKKKGGPGKVTKTSPKTAPKRKSSAGKAAKKPAKKNKKEESEEEDEDEEEDESEEEFFEDDEDEASNDGKTPKKSSPAKKTKSSLNAKGFPDKDGKFDLYIFKNDLSKDFKSDPKLCMWRRDGSSLLQKYLKSTEDDNGKDIFFKASSVYSCWEEKRKHDFFEIKVQCVGDKKDGLVKVLDVEELTKFALEDRPQIDTGINEEEAEEGGDNEEEDEGEEEPDEE
ncbi:hypothetical protein Bhyg_14913 [Pseudolycoriella hygida]|uniref:Uncharacterized protein n=1 Tax=Pseudolycoriella hygida TaxID=35572 RepID=A0A9Q0RW28_9DIPT|nr:hypothetical protein Bhyg_14913 [Pseudolycoriella hygida]